jgi:Mg-chelatase subunit ChlD
MGMLRMQFLRANGRAALIGGLALLALMPQFASADDTLDVRILTVDDSAFPALTVVVSIEAAGRPLDTLDGATITATDNGAPVLVKQVTRVQDAALPTTIVATIDTSGSMLGANMSTAKNALSGLVQRLAPTDSVSLISFSDRAQVIVAPTTDKSGVGNAVAALEAGGNTALYGAVAESARVAASAGSARRLVILLTDGEEFGNVSGVSREASLIRAAESGAIFYVIGLGVGADRGYLVQLAEVTGGRFLDAPTTADIERGYATIEETLKSQFVLSLESEAPPSPLTRDISLTVVSGELQGTATYTFESLRRLPTPPPPTPSSVPTTHVTQEPGGIIADDPPEPSGSTPIWPFLALGAVVALGIGAVGVRRRRAEPALIPTDLETLATEFRVAPTELVDAVPVGWLVPELVQQPGQGPGSFAIPPVPVSLGSASDCQIHLPQADGLAPLHARLWWKDGKVMMHGLEGGSTTLNGMPARWASLSDGDEVAFGPYRFRFTTRPGASPKAE